MTRENCGFLAEGSVNGLCTHKCIYYLFIYLKTQYQPAHIASVLLYIIRTMRLALRPWKIAQQLLGS